MKSTMRILSSCAVVAMLAGAGYQPMSLEEQLEHLEQRMALARANRPPPTPEPVDPSLISAALAARMEAVALETELVYQDRMALPSMIQPITRELAQRLAATAHLASDERRSTWLAELDAVTPRLLELDNDPLFHDSAMEMIRFYEQNDLPNETAFWLEAIAVAPSTTKREQLGALSRLTNLAYPSYDASWPANTGLDRSVDDIMNWFTRYDETLESARAEGAVYEPSHDAYYDETLWARANMLDKHVEHCLTRGDTDYRRLDDLAELAVAFHENQTGWVQQSQDAGRTLNPGKLSEWSAKSARSQARLSNLYARAGRVTDSGQARDEAIDQLDAWLSMNGDNRHRSHIKKDLFDLYWQHDLAPAELLRLVEPHLLEINEESHHVQSIYQWLRSGVFVDHSQRARLADLFVYNFQQRKTPEKLAKNVYYSFGLVESAISWIKSGNADAAWERFEELVQLSKDWPADRLDLVQSTFNRLTAWESRQEAAVEMAEAVSSSASQFEGRSTQPASRPEPRPIEELPAVASMIDEVEAPRDPLPVTTSLESSRASWYGWIPAGLIGVALVGFLVRIAIRSR